jgi:hypothetical protein
MSRPHIFLITVLIPVVTIGTAIAMYMVMDARLERQKAQVTSDLLQKQYDQVASDMAKRDAAYQATLRDYQVQLAHIKTVADVSKALIEPSPSLPKLAFNPFEVKPAPTASDPRAVAVTVPQDQIVPLYQNLAQCTLDRAALGKCQLDVQSMMKERDAAEGQADVWKKAVKGGGKISRLWFAFKVGGCGALGTAPGLVAKKTNLAIIGAAAGAGFCALTMHW